MFTNPEIPLPTFHLLMESRSCFWSTWARIASLICLIGELAASEASAPAPAKLGIQIYPGLTITGAVDTVYSIEFAADPSQTKSWRCLELVRLPATNYLWFDRSAPVTERRFYRAVAFPQTNMVFVPPGTFRMGSPTNEVDRHENEGPQTVVTLTRGFYMAKHKVTQFDYSWVLGAYPSVFTGDFSRPVETVDWEDATNYCARLTVRERAGGRIPLGTAYRLPTEAEWEYACRAWTSTRFSHGDDAGYKSLAQYAWYLDNGAHTTHPVGEKLPNPWGLFDMHGSLWEWCQDWYGSYSGGSVVDPRGPSSGVYRVYRGGSWGCVGGRCRSAVREANPEGETGYVGFRVVLAAVP